MKSEDDHYDEIIDMLHQMHFYDTLARLGLFAKANKTRTGVSASEILDGWRQL